MKIAVMGAGALGGYFGGRLAQAGHEVWLIARGAHLEAMQANGLKILSPKGDAHVTAIHATGDPAEVGPADVILFMVKNRDVESAGEAIRPMLGPDTFVVTCQNGVTAWERLGAIIGPERVLPGVARIPGDIPEPGTVRHSAEFDMLIFGEPGGGTSPRAEALAAALRAAGTTAVVPDNIQHELWSKFCSQATLASLTTLTGLDLGPLRETPASRQLFKDAINETIAVGRAVIPDLPDDVFEKNWVFVETLPATMHASMLDDLRRGKPIEHEYLSGDVVRLGAQYGVPTPIHSVLYAALKPIADQLETGAA
ncbi:2-dehydropantoate 2-reductase [Salipiger sp. P9]|uniref:ketopantoate reductase family protein n=1 Tax=Salipiger pentaromativorans TaxID=2943193 RepID=UPI002157D7CA|nr:2-dehydropantoate 2-reductase [Salipiger pentaromativorans]MCR8548023.1 2-dehydropantoate 2-reductase [Salipiger pentaromativorans]